MIQRIAMINRNGDVRINRCFSAGAVSTEHLVAIVSEREKTFLENIFETDDSVIACNRYINLYVFIVGTPEENPFYLHGLLKFLVSVLDEYFEDVTEKMIITKFDDVYFVIDEIFSGGKVTNTDVKSIIENIEEYKHENTDTA